MKNRTKQTLGFTAEIIFFVSTGGFIANRNWAYAAISLILAMIFAGWTGQLIKQEVREELK